MNGANGHHDDDEDYVPMAMAGSSAANNGDVEKPVKKTTLGGADLSEENPIGTHLDQVGITFLDCIICTTYQSTRPTHIVHTCPSVRPSVPTFPNLARLWAWARGSLMTAY